VIEDFKDVSDTFSVIQANVVVERKTQMPIIIGAGGTKIKELKDLAQKKLEEVSLFFSLQSPFVYYSYFFFFQFLDRKVSLSLMVKQDPDWRSNTLALKRYGYR
jgi:GTP-binding protein Era